jgi:hypothetical protein
MAPQQVIILGMKRSARNSAHFGRGLRQIAGLRRFTLKKPLAP